jgi:hypothetical protein
LFFFVNALDIVMVIPGDVFAMPNEAVYQCNRVEVELEVKFGALWVKDV